MSSTPKRVAFEFGPYRLDPAARRLSRDGEPLGLSPKAFDVLTVLVAARGRVVERERLMEEVWPGVAVVDANLTQTVSMLRKALDDTASEHRYIATVPGRGYQFTAPVEEAPAAPVAGEPRTPTVPGPEGRAQAQETASGGVSRRRSPAVGRRLVLAGLVAAVLGGLALAAPRFGKAPSEEPPPPQSLAVLPLTVVTPDVLDPAFGLGLTDAIINRLSNQGSVVVFPTQTVLAYADQELDPFEVGRELDVDLVLSGTVRRSDDQVRVSIQVLDVPRGQPLWAETFDQAAESLFLIEDQVAERVGRELALELLGAMGRGSRGTGTRDGEAYRQLLLGRGSFLWRSRDGYEEAVQHFEQALLRDPGYAAALAHLAMTRALMASNGGSWTPSRRLFDQASVEARRAIELDERISEAHIALGAVKMNQEYDWSGAIEELERAVELDPANTRARYLLAMALMLNREDGRAWEEALQIEQDLPPAFRGDGSFSFGILATFLGRYEEAAEALSAVRASHPYKGGARMFLGLCLEALGRREEALAELEAAVLHYPSGSHATATLAYFLGRSGDPAARERAREILRALEEKPEEAPGVLFSLALAHVGVGSEETAMRYLWQAHEAREVLPIMVQRDPRLDPLRAEPELQRLLQEMNLGPVAAR